MSSRNISAIQKNFANMPSVNTSRSVFNRSHSYSSCFDVDYLYPIMVEEIIPGDTIHLKPTIFARLNPVVAPFMDNLHFQTFFFFVPNRTVMDNWERLQGAQDNPDDSTDYLVPIFSDTVNIAEDSIYDYCGLQPGLDNGDVSQLPFRGMYKIWNEWFRDENLQDSLTYTTDDAAVAVSSFTLQKRNKMKDYFTSLLPAPQKGDAVTLSLGTSAPVFGDGNALGLWDGTTNFGLGTTGSGSALFGFTGNYGAAAATSGGTTGTALTTADIIGVSPSGNSGLFADLSQATASTINALREALQMQAIFELDARYGTRYVELLYGRFGVISPDFRLQRSEFLGSTRGRVNLSPVPQTSSTDVTTPQANLTANGVAVDTNFAFSKSFVEHGFVIGFINFFADLRYSQGVQKFWSRRTRFDHYEPLNARLGEQAVLQRELYVAGDATDDDVLGYQERWSEMRYHPSLLTSKMRPAHSSTLAVWNLSQEFGSAPALNSTFIEQATPIDRVLAVTTEPAFIADLYFDMTHIRPLPVYSVPYQLGRF